MKIKRIIILLLFLLIGVLTFNVVSSNNNKFEELNNFEYEEANIVVYEDELNDKYSNVMVDARELRLQGGGGGLGIILIYGVYYVASEFMEWFNRLPSNINYQVETSYLTIDDVLNYPDIKEGMDEYGWTKDNLIYWLEKMMDTTVEHFINDEENVIYLGASKDEVNKYNKSRDVENHKYAFYVDNSIWTMLEKECNSNYGMIWVLNMAFLQMAIMKKAKFILVTPSLRFYDYYNKKPIPNINEYGIEYYPFYGLELEYINDRGYFWDNQESAFVETYRN